MDGCVSGWVDGWMDGWTDRRKDGSIDERMGGRKPYFSHSFLY